MAVAALQALLLDMNLEKNLEIKARFTLEMLNALFGASGCTFNLEMARRKPGKRCRAFGAYRGSTL
jgi:hypothetical protein